MSKKIYNILSLPLKNADNTVQTCIVDGSTQPTDRTICGASLSKASINAYSISKRPIGQDPTMASLDYITCPHCRRLVDFVQKLLPPPSL